jgi:hypothetical protein
LDDLSTAFAELQKFTKGGLTRRIAGLEVALENADPSSCAQILARESVTEGLLSSAYVLKDAAGEINVVIHALGILLLVPQILLAEERVEYLSLGAGNTGRPFDLETNFRVAEFKFSRWRGGADTIRQNSMFKDFFQLAEYSTDKQKYLYILDLPLQLQFLHGRRALSSVTSKNAKIASDFNQLYGGRFQTVRDYFSFRRDAVKLVDMEPLLNKLGASDLAEIEPAADDI